VYNYVPVVRIADWILRDGAHILTQRTQKTARADLKNLIIQSGHAASILDTLPLEEIRSRIFDNKFQDKAATNRLAQFDRAAARMKLAASCDAEEVGAAQRLIESEATEAARLIKELCQNSIAEAYYIPMVDPDEAPDGHVALLREVRHIPRKLAIAIAEGLDHASYEGLCKINPRLQGRVNISSDEIAWPTGVILSPFIEHLMQRLTMLFSRIGVLDVGDEHFQNVKNNILPKQGAPT
jgi:hypothetical protein